MKKKINSKADVKETKDVEENEIINTIPAMIFMGGLFIYICFGLVISEKTKTCKAIVNAKGNNSIAFKNLEGYDRSLKVIKFEDAKKDMEYYNNIKVGDTISIRKRSTETAILKNRSFLYGSNIRKINGKKLKEIKKKMPKQLNQSKQKTK